PPRRPVLEVICRRKSRRNIHECLSDFLSIENAGVRNEFLQKPAGRRLTYTVSAVEPNNHDRTVTIDRPRPLDKIAKGSDAVTLPARIEAIESGHFRGQGSATGGRRRALRTVAHESRAESRSGMHPWEMPGTQIWSRLFLDRA